MCAAGSHEMTRAPSGKSMTFWVADTAASMFACVIWTPLGGPVVPEV
jgi:hypothetical protein